MLKYAFTISLTTLSLSSRAQELLKPSGPLLTKLLAMEEEKTWQFDITISLLPHAIQAALRPAASSAQARQLPQGLRSAFSASQLQDHVRLGTTEKESSYLLYCMCIYQYLTYV